MTQCRFDSIRALIAVPDSSLRTSILKPLMEQGLRHVRQTRDIDGVASGLARGEIDLLISTMELGGRAVDPLLQQLRHGRIGENAYVVVMVLMPEPSPEQVRRAVDSGTDDLLLAPIAPPVFLSRVAGFADARRPFVVTHDYIGPDRRDGDRSGMLSAPRVEVPNPIRHKSVNGGDPAAWKAQMRNANERINMHKMQSCSRQLGILAERIAASYGAGEVRQMQADAFHLSEIAEDLLCRMGSTGFAQARELAISLSRLCARLERDDRLAKAEEIEILPSLVQAFQGLFDSDPEMMRWLQQVA